MEAVMMGSSSYLNKLVSCRCSCREGFLCNFKAKSPLHLSLSLSLSSSSNNNNRLKYLSISLSSSPLVASSSHAQAEIDNHELLIQESNTGSGSVEAETQTVGVQFQLQRECSFGQNFLITGDHPLLGSWDPNNAISLTWSQGHIWTTHLDLPVGICIKFKLIMQESNGKFVWQPGPDRLLQCFQSQKIITLCLDWENPHSRIITETHPTMNQEIQFVAQEPKEYGITMEQVLVSDQVLPVLVPGLSQLPVNQDEPEPEPEPEPENGTAKDLTLPELESKGDVANTSNLYPRPEISSINENEVGEEQDHQSMTSLLHNDIQWSNNVMQKVLNIFGIH